MEAPSTTSIHAGIRLSELTNRIQEALDGIFRQQRFWIVADITSHTYKPQSNYHYFELVEKDKASSKILAKMAGRAWGNAAINISNFEKATGQKFKNDINVLIQVSVQYNPAFGIQLNLIDIDTSFTLGQFEQQRKATLERLLQENPDSVQRVGNDYITKNSQLPLNRVIQNIAIISSETSAGYQDFKHTLENNTFNYIFQIDNYFSLVQGELNSKQILGKIIEVYQSDKIYDALVIIRGGGSQMDFLIFDNYELSRAIARFPIPIITGIGHQKNETIADLMAHTATKTPTKAAEFIIAHNRNFEDAILDYQKKILINTFQIINLQKDKLMQLNNHTINIGRELLHKHQRKLINLSSSILSNPKIVIANRRNDLNNVSNSIQSYTRIYFINKQAYLGHFISVVRLMNPQNILNKGFAIVKMNDQILNNANLIEEGSELSISLAQSIITVTVNKKIDKHEESKL